jgi:hypothetical protein
MRVGTIYNVPVLWERKEQQRSPWLWVVFLVFGDDCAFVVVVGIAADAGGSLIHVYTGLER